MRQKVSAGSMPPWWRASWTIFTVPTCSSPWSLRRRGGWPQALQLVGDVLQGPVPGEDFWWAV